MKKRNVISESTLRNIIRRCISEKMEYDKERGAYYPKYTGDPHRDAGVYSGVNTGDDYMGADFYDANRGDYHWSDPDKGDRFHRLQSDYDLGHEESRWADRDMEADAENYLRNQEDGRKVDAAVEDMMDTYDSMLRKFAEEAVKRHPILRVGRYMDDFLLYLSKDYDRSW